MAYSFEKLLSLVPQGEDICWKGLEASELCSVFEEMKKTPQSKIYHAEGNVFNHTKLACEALVKQEEYKALDENGRAILFLSALLHDIGKTRVTRIENDDYTSPRHAIVGASMARELLWRDFNLCGTYEKQQMREAICNYIRFHSFPPFAYSDEKGEIQMLRIASAGATIKEFTFANLCLLGRADALGRISLDDDSYIQRIELCYEMARDFEVLKGPYPFNDAYSQRAYFKGQTTYKDDMLYDPTSFEVIMLCGLPGTGKDTYIAKNYPTLPVVSLDDIRKELGILPTENQGRVLSRATELMREYLRKKQSFVYNATNIDTQQRAPKISLCEDYGARVKIVFLEADWEENLKRNQGRKSVVPQRIIERMLSRLEPPQIHEAQLVEWIIN